MRVLSCRSWHLPVRRSTWSMWVLALAFVILILPTAQAATDEALLDEVALQQMEQRAATSSPRDQAYLYSEVLHGLTELAGRQMASGEDEKATATLQLADAVAAHMHNVALRDAKRLKNAELLLEHTTHRLADMVRVASTEQRANMQAVLRHFNSVHDDMLAAIFAH